MCQAGFLHKSTQTIPYQHPFIFCCFMEDDFVKFVEDFENIDFNTYKKLHYKESKIFHRKNDYSWDKFNDRLGIKTKNTPTIEFSNGVQLIYPHVKFNSFDEKYNKRLKRFFEIENKEICFIFRVKSFMDKKHVENFYKCSNFKKIILFEENVSFVDNFKDNEHTKIAITNNEHHYLVNYLSTHGFIDNC